MTPTAATTPSSDVRSGQRVADIPVGSPSYSDVIETISREAEAGGVPCDFATAEAVLEAYREAVEFIRHNGYDTCHHFSTATLQRTHDVMCVVTPGHQANPAPDTAHDKINRFLLVGPEVSVIHTSDTGHDQLVHCAAALSIDS